MTGSGRCSPISSPTGITIELAPGRMTLEAQRFDRWEKGQLDGRFGRPTPAFGDVQASSPNSPTTGSPSMT